MVSGVRILPMSTMSESICSRYLHRSFGVFLHYYRCPQLATRSFLRKHVHKIDTVSSLKISPFVTTYSYILEDMNNLYFASNPGSRNHYALRDHKHGRTGPVTPWKVAFLHCTVHITVLSLSPATDLTFRFRVESVHLLHSS